MRAVLKRIQFEVIFAVVALIAIPIFLIMTWWNATRIAITGAPTLIEKIVWDYVYGE